MLVSFPMKGPIPPPHPLLSRDPQAVQGQGKRGGGGDQGLVFLPSEPSLPTIRGMAGRVWALEVDWHSCPLTLPGWAPESWGLLASMGCQGPGSLRQDRSPPLDSSRERRQGQRNRYW